MTESSVGTAAVPYHCTVLVVGTQTYTYMYVILDTVGSRPAGETIPISHPNSGKLSYIHVHVHTYVLSNSPGHFMHKRMYNGRIN